MSSKDFNEQQQTGEILRGLVQAEQALRESKELLDESQRMAHLGSWELDLSDLEDPSRNELKWSDESYRIFGYEPGEVGVTNGLFFLHVHPDDRESIKKSIAAALCQEGPYEIDHRITRLDGTERICHQWARIVRNREGRPVRMLGTCQDITERKRAEQALRESEERFRQVVENIREVFWMSDPEKDQILYVSPGYEQIWARTCESLYASPRSWLESIHPEDRARVLDASLTKQASGQYNEEYRIIRPDGSIRWILDRAFPIWDASGEVYRVAGIAEDITERKEREKAIAEHIQTITKQVKQLTTLNQTVAAITSVLDIDNLLSTVLHLLAENLGYRRILLMLYDSQRRLVYGARVAGVSQDVERLVRGLEIPIRDDGSIQAELLIHGHARLISDCEAAPDYLSAEVLSLIRKLGVTCFVCVPLKSTQRILGFVGGDRGDDACTRDDLDLLETVAAQIGVAIDKAQAYQELEQLTHTLERRVQERTRELQAANEKLQELDRLKSSFVSIVSHELRTPMTSIKGFIENMRDGLTGALIQRQIYYLDRVKFNAERITRLIDDLLDLSRMESGRVTLNPTAVPVREFITDVVEAFEPMARVKGVNLTACHSTEPAVILADRDKLNQVLTNLIQNAIKFTPCGGEVRVEMQAGQEGDIQFCVLDTGCGIPLHELSRVFEGFYRGKSVRPEQRGAGLGLAITKSLVELHGGRIWAESLVGKGSRFSFTIPRAR